MKTIPVSQGRFAMVDDDDFERISAYSWTLDKGTNCNHAFRGTKKNGVQKNILMHHMVLPFKEGLEVDHKDGNGLNNQKSNLRLCTRSQNKANQSKHWKGTSKYKGVSWCSRDKRWTVRIKITGKSINLGNFKNEIDAAKAYDSAAIDLFREFANLNFKD